MELSVGDLAIPERYKLLTGLVFPRPIALVSTWSEYGVANCAPYSYFNAMCEDPMLVVLSFGERSDGKPKHSLANLLRTGEFVVNLVDERIANGMHLASAELPEEVSEFEQSGFTPAPCKIVSHPRILEAHVPVGPGNPFGLGPQAPAVVGRYRTRGGAADLLVVEYPDAPAAEAAAAIFSQRFLDGTQPARRDGGWCAATALSERARAYVLRAPSLEEALALLAEATQGGPP